MSHAFKIDPSIAGQSAPAGQEDANTTTSHKLALARQAAAPVQVTPQQSLQSDAALIASASQAASDRQAMSAAPIRAAVGADELNGLLDQVKQERFRLMHALKSVKARREKVDETEGVHQDRFEALVARAERLEAIVGQRASDLLQLQTTVDARLDRLAQMESAIESAADRFAKLLHKANDHTDSIKQVQTVLDAHQAGVISRSQEAVTHATHSLELVDQKARQRLIDLAEQARGLVTLDLPKTFEKAMAKHAKRLVDEAVGDVDTLFATARVKGQALIEKQVDQMTQAVMASIRQQVLPMVEQSKKDSKQAVAAAADQAADAIAQTVSEQRELVQQLSEQANTRLSEQLEQRLEQLIQEQAQTALKQAQENAAKAFNRFEQDKTASLSMTLDAMYHKANEKAQQAADEFGLELKTNVRKTCDDAHATSQLLANKIKRLESKARQTADEAVKAVDLVLESSLENRVQAQLDEKIEQATQGLSGELKPVRDQVIRQAKALEAELAEHSLSIRQQVQEAAMPAEEQLTTAIDQVQAKLKQRVDGLTQDLTGRLEALVENAGPQATEAVTAAQTQLRAQVAQMTESAQAMVEMTERKLKKRIDALTEQAQAAEQAVQASADSAAASANAAGSGPSINVEEMESFREEIGAEMSTFRDRVQDDINRLTDLLATIAAVKK